MPDTVRRTNEGSKALLLEVGLHVLQIVDDVWPRGFPNGVEVACKWPSWLAEVDVESHPVAPRLMAEIMIENECIMRDVAPRGVGPDVVLDLCAPRMDAEAVRLEDPCPGVTTLKILGYRTHKGE